MIDINTSWFRNLAIAVFLLYPIMAIKYIPFGGGARYMSVLAGPLAIFVLVINYKRINYKTLWNEGLSFTCPFIPLVLCVGFSMLFHGQDFEFITILTRVLYGCLIYLGAKELDLSEKNLIYAACLAGFIFFGVSLYEVYFIGRERAFGGTYENRFAQFSMMMFGLSVIYILKSKGNVSSILKVILGLSAFSSLYAVFLTQSRGPLLVIPILIIFFVRHHIVSRLVIISSSMVFLTVMATFFLLENINYLERLQLAGDELIRYFNEHQYEGASVGIRLELWWIAFQTISFDNIFGLGRLSFVEIGRAVPALARSTIIVSNHFPMNGELYPWKYHGDIPEAVGFGGVPLFLSYIATMILLLKRSLDNLYLLWIVCSLFIFGLSELVVFDKYGFTLFVSCWALYSAAQVTRLRFDIGNEV